MAGALEGFRVLDFCDHRGEMAGRVLADLGAEVICIEPPGGIASRNRGPLTADGRSLWWETFALGKKSVVVDPARDDDKLRQLARTADVAIASAAPGEKSGPNLAELREINPVLVTASITPFGQNGPRSEEAAMDLTVEAAGGLVGLQGDTDRPPLPVGFPQASLHAGVQAAADILIALNARELTGRGQHLDVSTQSAVVWTLMNATGWPAVVGTNPPGFCDTRHLPRATVIEGMRTPRLFDCKDGNATFGVHLPGVGERTMAGAIGWLEEAHPDLVDEELLTTDWTRWMSLVREGEISVDLYNKAYDAVAEAFTRTTKADLLVLAVERKLLIAPILTTSDLFEDEHLATRDFWTEVNGFTFAGPFAKLSATPIEYRSPAPGIGEHQHILDSSRKSRSFSPNGARRALDGLKVADFAWVGVGPIMSKALADHGADVIHIESSQRLDVLRTIGPFKDKLPGVNRSHFFSNFNTNKKSIDLNFKDPDDLAIAREIAEWADVLVESFVPGTMARYSLDYTSLKQTNPGLIMLSTCMRGQTGPHRSYGGFGNQGSALAGLFSLTGWPDRPPTGPWGAYTDFITPRFGVAAIAAALLHKRQTGQGQYIDVAQIEAGIHFMGALIPAYKATGLEVSSPGMSSLYASPHGVFVAHEENTYVAVAVETDEQWRALCGLLKTGEPGWDETVRRAHEDVIQQHIAEWVAGRTAGNAEAELLDHGIPAARVLWPSDLYEDPQLFHRTFFQKLDHPEMGPAFHDGHVTQFSDTPPNLETAGPTLGQHSDEIRKRFSKETLNRG